MRKILQIATVGEDPAETLAGIRSFPANKVILICYEAYKGVAEEMLSSLGWALRLPVEVHGCIREENPFLDMIEATRAILVKEQENYNDIIVNVSGGDKLVSSAAVAAAFIHGLRAFYCKGDSCLMLPFLKLNYTEILSGAKRDILIALNNVGGEVTGLTALGKLTKYGKPLLSYHLNGSEDSRGLIDLGLVETERVRRGQIIIKLTVLGKLVALGRVHRDDDGKITR